jgi:hypothetical protein
MLNAAALFSVTLTLLNSSIDQSCWSRAISRSKSLDAHSSTSTPPNSNATGAAMSSNPTLFLVDERGQVRPATQSEEALYSEELSRQSKEVAKMRDMAESGNLSSAANRLEDISTTIQSEDLTALLGTIYIQQGRISSAVRLVGPKTLYSDDQRLLMIAALLNSIDGQVAKGQMEYCKSIVLDSAGGFPEANAALNFKPSLQAAKALGALAIGTDAQFHGRDNTASWFYGQAWKLEHGNSFIGYRYATTLRVQKNMVLARKVATEALPRSSGKLKLALIDLTR